LGASVDEFDAFFTKLDEESDSVRRNVRKLLATKFFNHWYSALLLCESALLVDAVVCERSAIETMAFHWLVCLDPTAAEAYHGGAIPRPVVVRRRLEALGVDITHVREAYSAGSGIGHVSRASERFHLNWEAEGSGILFVAGRLNPADVDHWFTYLPALLHMFQSPTMAGGTPPGSGV
jgi:hypothetical protein